PPSSVTARVFSIVAPGAPSVVKVTVTPGIGLRNRSPTNTDTFVGRTAPGSPTWSSPTVPMNAGAPGVTSALKRSGGSLPTVAVSSAGPALPGSIHCLRPAVPSAEVYTVVVTTRPDVIGPLNVTGTFATGCVPPSRTTTSGGTAMAAPATPVCSSGDSAVTNLAMSTGAVGESWQA